MSKYERKYKLIFELYNSLKDERDELVDKDKNGIYISKEQQAELL